MHRWALICFIAAALGAAATAIAGDRASEGRYRLPFADGTQVEVFDDATTHRPKGRVDLFALGGQAPYRVVAAAAGRIVAIQDGYGEQQSGRAAKDCHNNYVWIEHPNGEWSNYSHLARGTVTGRAGLKVGDAVRVQWSEDGTLVVTPLGRPATKQELAASIRRVSSHIDDPTS